MYTEEHRNKAVMLIDKLTEAWNELEIPEIPDGCEKDWDFGEFLPFAKDKKWDEIDIYQCGLDTECWVDSHLPLEIRLYYSGALLKYSLQFFCDHYQTFIEEFADGGCEFSCCLRCIDDFTSKAKLLPPSQGKVVFEICDFLTDKLECYGFDEYTFPELTENLKANSKLFAEVYG